MRAAAAVAVASSSSTTTTTTACAPSCSGRRRRAPLKRERRACAATLRDDVDDDVDVNDDGDGAYDTTAMTRATTCARLSNFIYKGASTAAWIAGDGFEVLGGGATGATAWSACERRNERFIVVRGASWNQPDTDRNKLSWQIAKVWPMALKRGVPVVAHQGVLEMVEEFWRDVKPYLEDETFTGKFSFTGHSLGGSMALIIAARCRLELGIAEERIMPVHTFGSPPVLAYDRLSSRGTECEGTMDDILRLCGFSKGASAVRQYVLAKDIIPRMWLSADPVFNAATKMDFIGSMLDWREQTFGGGMLTRNRFLYQTCGDLFWLEYQAGVEAKPLLTRHTGEDVLEKLQMELGEVTESPLAALRTALDHNSQNYVDALQFLTVKRIISTSQ